MLITHIEKIGWLYDFWHKKIYIYIYKGILTFFWYVTIIFSCILYHHFEAKKSLISSGAQKVPKDIQYRYFENIFVLVLNYHKLPVKKVFQNVVFFLEISYNLFFEVPNIKIGKLLNHLDPKEDQINLKFLLIILKKKIIWW